MKKSFPEAVFQDFREKSAPAQVAPRISTLRAAMRGMHIDGILVPRADVHQGEYVPDCDARLAYITGFTGSAGLAAITSDKAALFVDSRYTLQAPAQTDTGIVEVIDTTGLDIGEWLADNLPTGTRLGFDPWLMTPGRIEALRKPLEKAGISLLPTDNPIDTIWNDRPLPPQGTIDARDSRLAGRSSADKLADLHKEMKNAAAEYLVLTLPESICWLFNIRGRDIPHNPFVLAFAIVPVDGTPTIFVPENKLTPGNEAALGGGANLADKAGFGAALKSLAASGATVWIDPDTAPFEVKALLSQGATLVEKRDPVLLPKSRKNDAELEGMREAHRRDARAMIRFLAWFDEQTGRDDLSEIELACVLEAFRREDETLVDISFETISGAGPDGAIVHYRVTESTNRILRAGELMLLDSGGQYLSGTTDITRTLPFGEASAEQRDRFTRVLKGMIAVSQARFPKGTTGAQIDILARQYLWQVGLTYNHGTGHGVGAFLSVHEGPAGISPRYNVPFETGMVISNEPGYYSENAYGIRIENVIAVREAPNASGFLEFETLTLVPIDTRLIEPGLLSASERDWLNAYHRRIVEEIGPDLDTATRDWLARATQPV